MSATKVGDPQEASLLFRLLTEHPQQPHRRLAPLELQASVKLKAGCLAGTVYVEPGGVPTEYLP